MKLQVEPGDIKEVQNTASGYFGVIVEEAKAQELLTNKRLASELIFGHLDTLGRDVLAEYIVEDVLKGIPCNIHNGSWGKGWIWPLYGSSEEYKDAFDQAFMENAPNRGYKLAKCWEKK